MRNRSKARFANGIVSAILVVFFLVHGLLGCMALMFGYASPFAVVVWAGMALVAVHVIASIVTSREQLTDAERPPSPRKKRHLALKWATGIGLALCIAAHVVLKDAFGARLAIVAVAALLAVHLCVGSKSLLVDLNVDRRFQLAFRVVACLFAVVVVASVLASFWRM